MYYGATVLHGCDLSADAIRHANELFADYRHVEARFEVVDLVGGAGAIKKAFGDHYRKQYDITLMLAVYHKLRRVMELPALLHLVEHLAHHCGKFFVWRGAKEISEFEPVLINQGFRRVHYSEIGLVERFDTHTTEAQPCAIWARNHPL